MKIGIVVVIYNHWCGDSETCKAFQNSTVAPDCILIMDNSTKDYHNAEYCADQGWLYCSMGGNKGLTKAYNRGLELLKDRVDLVVWADDDTLFPADYISTLLEYVKEDSQASVFLPVVKSGEVYLSPAVFKNDEVVQIFSLNQLNGQEITGINSGMAVKISVYQNYRYDERLFLDYVDHDFTFWCRKNGIRFCVMDRIVIEQEFFGLSQPSAKSRRFRARIYTKDYRLFCSKCGRSPLRVFRDLAWYWIFTEYMCVKSWIKGFHRGKEKKK